MHIDPFSTTIFTILISFMMSMGLFVVSFNYLREVKGVGYWATALLWAGLGWLLLALNGVISNFFSLVIGTVFCLLGIVFYSHALAAFIERRVSMYWLYVVVVIAFIGNYYFIEINFNMAAKIAVTSSAAAIVLFANSLLLFSKRHDCCSHTHCLTGSFFALSGGIYFVRAIYYFVWNTQAEQAFFNVNLMQDLAYISNPILYVGTALGFALMCIEKYINEKNQAQELLRTAQQAAGMHNYVTDLRTGLSSNTAELNAIYGVDMQFPHTIDSFKSILHPEDCERVMTCFWESIDNHQKHISVEYRTISPISGEVNWIAAWGLNFYDDEQKPLQQIGMIQDITERKQIEIDLRIAATVFESHEGMLITDANGVMLKVNHAFTKITGYSAVEAVGQTPRLLSSGRHDKDFYTQLWQAIHDEDSWQGEIWNRRKNGEIYPEWLMITAVKTNNDEVVTHYVATLTDITERKAAEEQIQQLAFYDPLTNLPNRRLLYDRLKHGIALSQRTGKYMAVLMLDLDKFKAVNDTLGHTAGDELLQQVAQRIKAHLREMDTVGRLGGDEFVVLLEAISHIEQVAVIANNIIHALKQPFTLCQTQQAHIGTSIGIALYPQHGSDIEMLMNNADTALYQAKDNGRGCFAYFGKAGLSITKPSKSY